MRSIGSRIDNNSDPKSKLPIPNIINKLIKFYEPVGIRVNIQSKHIIEFLKPLDRMFTMLIRDRRIVRY